MAYTVEAWAFRADEQEQKQARLARYQELVDQGFTESTLPNRKVQHLYARNIYKFDLTDELRKLSDLDLALICDDGNTCFGAMVYRSSDSATVEIHTD